MTLRPAPPSVAPNFALGDDGGRWDDRLSAARRSGHLPSLPREAWIEAVDPYRSGAWTRRLTWAGLDENAEIKADPPRAEPQWLKTLAEMRAVAARMASAPLAEVPADLPFAHIFQPIVEAAWTRVAPAAESDWIADSAAADLRRSLLGRLCGLANRPLGELFCGERTLVDVAFTHIAEGTTPGSRTQGYERFCRQLLSTGLEPLLTEFPVLGRPLATVLMQWERFCRELLSRLVADRSAIQRVFSIAPEAQVTSLVCGLGDPHHEGRGVVAVSFSEHGRLVYKPRSVDIEERYHEFVATVNFLLPSDPLRQLTVLARDGYGYVEYVEPKPSANGDSLLRFYRNAGRTLAVLYLLGATDCHWENMVAADDQIVLIDAETLFEGKQAPWDDGQIESTPSAVQDNIVESVLRTGMLPAWISIGAGESIDISALGTPGSDRGPPARAGWCFTNTDDMVWGDREGAAIRPLCLPVRSGMPNPLAEYSEPLVTGFDEVLALGMEPEARTRLRASLENFRGAKRRIVVRPTRTYVLLQAEALTPDSLRDANSRALQLERLARAFTAGRRKPEAWPIFEQEIAAMESLDVPYFEGIVGSQGLYARGEEIVEGYFEIEGLEQALQRLDRISDAERAWQARLIHGSIAAHRFEMRSRKDPAVAAEVATGGPRHQAADIADLIRADALDEPSGRPTWLTVALLADATRVQLGLVPPGLYDGRAGIAAFLYDHGESDMAEAVLAPVFDILGLADDLAVRRFAREIGSGMGGVGGILRVFQYRAESDSDSEIWLARSQQLLQVLTNDLLAADPASDSRQRLGRSRRACRSAPHKLANRGQRTSAGHCRGLTRGTTGRGRGLGVRDRPPPVGRPLSRSERHCCGPGRDCRCLEGRALCRSRRACNRVRAGAL